MHHEAPAGAAPCTWMPACARPDCTTDLSGLRDPAATLWRYLVSHDSYQEPVMSERPPAPLSPPVYHVLLALGGGALHGYGIMQRFEQLLGGAEQILPGTLYATLARMVQQGLIEETRGPRGEESGGPPRRHYRVTARGAARGCEA